MKERLDKHFQGLKRTRTDVYKNEYSKNEAYAYAFPLKSMLKKIFELPGIYGKVMNYKELLKKESDVILNFGKANCENIKLRIPQTKLSYLTLFSATITKQETLSVITLVKIS